MTLCNCVPGVPHKQEVKPSRYIVDALISGAGFVIVDLSWREQMRGPFRKRHVAQSRCDELNAATSSEKDGSA